MTARILSILRTYWTDTVHLPADEEYRKTLHEWYMFMTVIYFGKLIPIQPLC